MKPNRKLTYLAVCLSIVFIATLIWAIFINHYPLKSTEDTWHYLASIHELRHDYKDINDPFFISGPRDVHYGPYLLAAAMVSKIFDASVINTYLVFGLINVLLLVAGLMTFYRSLYPQGSRSEGFVFCIFSFFCWGGSQITFSGYFSFSDLLLNGAAPANFGLGVALLALALLIRSKKLSLAPYALFVILSFLTFVSHALTGVMLFLVLFIYLLVELIREKRLTPKIIAFGLVPIIVLGAVFSWPYYSFYDFIFNKTSLINGQGSDTPLRLGQWIATGGVGIFGILYVIKSKNYFLITWVLVFMLVLLSYLTPFHISLYWRFLPLMLVPCFAVVFRYIVQTYNKSSFSKLILLLFLLFGLAATRSKYLYRLNWHAYTQNEWPELGSLSQSKVVLSDPYTSYIAAGLYGVNVVAVTNGHENPSNELASTNRSNDVSKLFQQTLTKEELRELVKKYSVSEVLVNNSVSYTYNWHHNDSEIAELSDNTLRHQTYTIYHIKADKI